MNTEKSRRLSHTLKAITLFSAAAFVSSCRVQDGANRIAFVYGISLYNTANPEDDGNGPNLEFCDDDAYDMATLFESSGYLVYRRISGVTGNTPDSLPTRDQILADIASVPAGTDRVVFYYSGHGIEWVSASGTEQYIIPYGAISGGVVFDQLISAGEFHASLSYCPAAQKICIFDSCYSGGFVSYAGELELCPPIFGPQDEYGTAPAPGILDPSLVSPILLRYMAGQNPPSDAIVLSAAGSMELSWEENGHGIFTGGLLNTVAPPEGSSGRRARADSDSDGVISVIEAFSSAADSVERNWNYSPFYESDTRTYSDFFPHVSSGSLDAILFSY